MAKVFGIVLAIAVVAFLVWQIVLLVRDIKARRKQIKDKNKNNDDKGATDTVASTLKEDN